MAMLGGIRRLFAATTERWLRVPEPLRTSPVAERLGRLKPAAPARVREAAGLVTYQHAMDHCVEQSRNDLDDVVAHIEGLGATAEGSSEGVELRRRG